MPAKIDRTTVQSFGYNARLECSCNALLSSLSAGVIGLFLPLTLRYIRFIPSNIQSKTLMAFVGCGTLSMLVLKIEMSRCPPEDISKKTTSV